jgi:hypothetical protein
VGPLRRWVPAATLNLRGGKATPRRTSDSVLSVVKTEVRSSARRRSFLPSSRILRACCDSMRHARVASSLDSRLRGAVGSRSAIRGTKESSWISTTLVGDCFTVLSYVRARAAVCARLTSKGNRYDA